MLIKDLVSPIGGRDLITGLAGSKRPLDSPQTKFSRRVIKYTVNKAKIYITSPEAPELIFLLPAMLR